MKLQSIITGLLASLFSLVSHAHTGPDSAMISFRQPVPEELVGKWLNGTFSMNNWWAYDGREYLGNPYSRSAAFHFNKNGDAEFYLAVKNHTGNCSTEAFTFFKGAVSFNDAENSFTLTPAKGNFRVFYSCTPRLNTDRKARAEELKPTTYYWSMETDAQDKTWLVIRFSRDKNAAATYFKSTRW
jgi:hypothetical protein